MNAIHHTAVADTVHLIATGGPINPAYQSVHSAYDLRWTHNAQSLARVFQSYIESGCAVDVHYESNETQENNDFVTSYNAWLDSVDAQAVK